MGEFGRTPQCTGGGRNYWSRAWSSVLIGGGIRGGQVVGRTNRDGATVVDRPISMPDFLGTICAILGYRAYVAVLGGVAGIAMESACGDRIHCVTEPIADDRRTITNISVALRRLPNEYRSMSRKRISGHLFRRGGALLCLAAFLLGNANLLPVAAALAARLEGSHEVRVTSQEDGICVVLHHPSGPAADPRMLTSHPHGLVCGLFCELWARPGGESDHLLAFATGSLCESEFAAEKLLAAGKARVAPKQSESFFCPALLAIQTICCQALAMLPDPPNPPPRLVAAGNGRSLHLLI